MITENDVKQYLKDNSYTITQLKELLYDNIDEDSYNTIVKSCSGDDLNYILSGTGKAICCYSPPILSTNRHRILSFRHWLCQAIGILFCQRNEMLLRKTKAINPITNLAHKQIAASSGFESG